MLQLWSLLSSQEKQGPLKMYPIQPPSIGDVVPSHRLSDVPSSLVLR